MRFKLSFLNLCALAVLATGCNPLSIRGVSTSLISTCDATATPFAGGSGTSGDPYKICSIAQLNRVGTNPYNNKYFILVNDLNYQGVAADSITGFDGSLDGRNHLIENFTSDPSTPTGGLFDSSSATFKNLNLRNFSVTSGTYRIGSLVGNFSGTADNITLTNAVVYSDLGESEVGGVFGVANSATISNITVINADVSSDGHNTSHAGNADPCLAKAGAGCVGGIVGSASNSMLTNCTVAGTSKVSGLRPGTAYIGGAIGGISGSNSNTNILSSHSNASVYGDTLVGGVAGSFFSASVTSKIQDSDASGTVNYYYSTLAGYTPIDYDGGGVEIGIAGGLVGISSSSEIRTSHASGNVQLISTAYLTSIGSTLPTPSVSQSIGGLAGVVNNTAAVSGGGLVDSSYASGNVAGKNNSGGLVGKIKNGLISNSHSDSSTVTCSNTNCGGLVGAADLTDFSNNHSSSNVVGYIYAGGLVGRFIGGATNNTIDQCYASGSVSLTATGYTAGGLAGFVGSTDITNSYSTGAVSGSGASMDSLGGLVGYLEISTVDHSFSKSNVTGYYNTGGLIGAISYVTVSHSFATGNVTGYGAVGGLVGNFSDQSTLQFSLSTGNVSGNQDVGGLFGKMNTSGGANAFSQVYTSSSITTTGGAPGNIDAFIGLDSDSANTVKSGYYYLAGTSSSYSGSIASVSALETAGSFGAFTFPAQWRMSSSGLPHQSPIPAWICSSALPTGISCF